MSTVQAAFARLDSGGNAGASLGSLDEDGHCFCTAPPRRAPNRQLSSSSKAELSTDALSSPAPKHHSASQSVVPVQLPPFLPLTLPLRSAKDGTTTPTSGRHDSRPLTPRSGDKANGHPSPRTVAKTSPLQRKAAASSSGEGLRSVVATDDGVSCSDSFPRNAADTGTPGGFAAGTIDEGSTHTRSSSRSPREPAVPEGGHQRPRQASGESPEIVDVWGTSFGASASAPPDTEAAHVRRSRTHNLLAPLQERNRGRRSSAHFGSYANGVDGGGTSTTSGRSLPTLPTLPSLPSSPCKAPTSPAHVASDVTAAAAAETDGKRRRSSQSPGVPRRNGSLGATNRPSTGQVSPRQPQSVQPASLAKRKSSGGNGQSTSSGSHYGNSLAPPRAPFCGSGGSPSSSASNSCLDPEGSTHGSFGTTSPAASASSGQQSAWSPRAPEKQQQQATSAQGSSPTTVPSPMRHGLAVIDSHVPASPHQLRPPHTPRSPCLSQDGTDATAAPIPPCEPQLSANSPNREVSPKKESHNSQGTSRGSADFSPAKPHIILTSPSSCTATPPRPSPRPLQKDTEETPQRHSTERPPCPPPHMDPAPAPVPLSGTTINGSSSTQFERRRTVQSAQPAPRGRQERQQQQSARRDGDTAPLPSPRHRARTPTGSPCGQHGNRFPGARRLDDDSDRISLTTKAVLVAGIATAALTGYLVARAIFGGGSHPPALTPPVLPRAVPKAPIDPMAQQRFAEQQVDIIRGHVIANMRVMGIAGGAK